MQIRNRCFKEEIGKVLISQLKLGITDEQTFFFLVHRQRLPSLFKKARQAKNNYIV